MSNDGIVRHIDDQGRIMIPKELRRMSHWKNGDPILILPHGNEAILLKKYHELEGLVPIASLYSSSFYSVYHVPIAICNETVFLTSRGFRFSGNPHISNELKLLMEEGHEYARSEGIRIALDLDIKGNIVIPITNRDVVIGAVALGAVDRKEMSRLSEAARLIVSMITNQMQF